jgi:hypothetical protein
VKEKGKLLAGLEVLDNNEKVTSMMIQYKDIKRLNRIIMRGFNPTSTQTYFIERSTQQSVNQTNQASKSKVEKGKSNNMLEKDEDVADEEGAMAKNICPILHN